MSVTEYVFVYGTLRETGGNGRLIKSLTGQFTGRASLPGHEMWTKNWIPYILQSAPGTESVVTGDLVKFDERALKRALHWLDNYEGYMEGHEEFCSYHRRLVNVLLPDGSTQLAYCYVANEYLVRPYQDGNYARVPDNDYTSMTGGY